MKNFISGTFFVLVVIYFGATSALSAGYVGMKACFKCHPKAYNEHVVSGHPYKLMRAEHSTNRPLPLPDGYTWEDISYVIGGAYKKARYIDLNGYIITAAKDGSELKTQYNIEDGSWSFYHKGEKKKYDCGPCHTTGYNPDGNQDGREGLVGTWSQPGVHCEACHGPAGDHIKDGDPSMININTSSSLCGGCHVRGAKEKIPASGGFIKHHEQFPEFLQSPHRDLNCTTCHYPHRRASLGMRKTCSDCHEEQAKSFAKTPMSKGGLVSCKDCHMPRVIKSATKKGPFEADIRTHLITINLDQNAQMFYKEDGETFAKNFITADYVCLPCHKDKDRKWAEKNALKSH